MGVCAHPARSDRMKTNAARIANIRSPIFAALRHQGRLVISCNIISERRRVEDSFSQQATFDHCFEIALVTKKLMRNQWATTGIQLHATAAHRAARRDANRHCPILGDLHRSRVKFGAHRDEVQLDVRLNQVFPGLRQRHCLYDRQAHRAFLVEREAQNMHQQPKCTFAV